jgi:hypothetical protein
MFIFRQKIVTYINVCMPFYAALNAFLTLKIPLLNPDYPRPAIRGLVQGDRP